MAALAALAVLSCSRPYEKVWGLEVNSESYTLSYEGDDFPVWVYCSGDWSALLENGEDWISIAPGTESGNGTGVVRIKCSYNTTQEDRTAVLVLRSGSLEKEVYMNQSHDDIRRPGPRTPLVTLDRTLWSEAEISWTCEEKPEGWDIYVNDAKLTESPLAADVKSYRLKGLNVNETVRVAVLAFYPDGVEKISEDVEVMPARIAQLTKNLSPTSVSVSIENKSVENTGNNTPCLYVELYDGPDPASAKALFSTYVKDAQGQTAASPFLTSLIVDEKASRTPLNIAFGGLEPEHDYWFRVRSAARYEWNDAKSFLVSAMGDSEWSSLVKLSTPPSHTAASDELFFEGFDDLFIQADYVNGAVGSVPAFKEVGKKVSDISSPEIVRNWGGNWCFYGLWTAFPSTQIAFQYGWGTQITKTDGVFTISGGLVSGTAPGAGTKICLMKASSGSLSGWYFSNNVFPAQGCVELGTYYNVGDKSDPKQGMIVTPALDSESLGAEPSQCRLDFKGLVLQGRSCTLGVWVYDSASKTWTEAASVKMKNSAGSEDPVEAWSMASETHCWHSHSVSLSLRRGDRIALVSDKQGAALIDEITVSLESSL